MDMIKSQLTVAQQTIAAWKELPPNQPELDMLTAQIRTKDRELQKAREDLDKKETQSRAAISAVSKRHAEVDHKFQLLKGEWETLKAQLDEEKRRRIVAEQKWSELEQKVSCVVLRRWLYGGVTGG
jgi:chromosome segregation ATPase